MLIPAILVSAVFVGFGMWASGGTLPPPGFPVAKRCPHCDKVIDDRPHYGGGPG